MHNRWVYVVVVGLLVAVLVSACGVALGPVQFESGGPGVVNPIMSGLHLPGLQPAVLNSLHEVQRWQSLQEQAQALYGVGGCHGDH